MNLTGDMNDHRGCVGIPDSVCACEDICFCVCVYGSDFKRGSVVGESRC